MVTCTPGFDLGLVAAPNVPAPYDASSELISCAGRLFLGNDGGLYRTMPNENCSEVVEGFQSLWLSFYDHSLIYRVAP